MRVKMSIGANIKELREDRKLTQNQVADTLGITFQAVSAIAEEKHGAFKTKDAIYDWEHMKTYVKIQSDSDQSQSCAHKVPGQM